MSRAARRLRHAIRITPPGDRDRYADEWRYDVSSAAELGISPMEVANSATRVAWRLRVRRWGRTLAGAEGGGRATLAWVSVLASLPVLFLIGGPLAAIVLPAAILVALFLVHQDQRSSRMGSVVLLGSAALWLACTIIVWWLWGVSFDAEDNFQPQPAVTKWAGPAFLVGLGAFITFWATFVVSVVRIARRAEST